MKEVIVFKLKDSDPFLYKEVDYNFSIGDNVCHILTPEERQQLNGFYPYPQCEGVISEKWINITDMRILWTVEVS